MTLTIVMRRSDPAGFQAYLADVYDSSSPQYRKFLTPPQVTARFGPSQEDYAAVSDFFLQRGFRLGESSRNRMTLSVIGTRALVEQALAVTIKDFQIGNRAFRANVNDPLLPADIAPHVEAIIGLNSLAAPQSMWSAIVKVFCSAYAYANAFENFTDPSGNTAYTFKQTLYDAALKKCMTEHGAGGSSGSGSRPGLPTANRQLADGAGQTVGIVAFDTFPQSDVVNYIAARGLPAPTIGNITQVHVNGGATAGASQSEVLLDIDTVISNAPGAKVVVFDAPFGASSFQGVFNAMINANVDIITNSWAYCEDQTTQADVQSIDAILQTAAASGISAFTGSGDHGSTCLDGRPNTVHVPANSPHITAVGGTSLVLGPGFTYGSETWWDSSAASPPGGQGGYGVSAFFARPAYQNGQTAAANRSVPDVSANADPAQGVYICQESAGGCPSGYLFGGTSKSAPAWAAYTALLNDSHGSRLGFMNPLFYPLAATDAFHNAASMGSDFAHVGLGSPNLARLRQRLNGQTVGPVDAAVSQVIAYSAGNEFWVPNDDGLVLPILADGTTLCYVVVYLSDANGNIISGATVSLAGNAGSHAVITPVSPVTNAANGAAIFKVTNLSFETVTFTATVTAGGIVLADKPAVLFGPPFAASASINAGPTTVLNNGVATTTITVTLKDGLGRASPGKLVTLAQGSGHSVVSGPNPSVTNASGTIQFTATDTTAETVTYTAVDVSDGNLAVPGSAIVTFTGQPSSPCFTLVSSAAPGFTLTPFTTGFVTNNLFFGNVNWGCRGASNPAWTADGSVYVNNFLDGSVFKFPAQGGVASNSAKLSTLGPSLFGPVTGKDGRLYAARGATTGNFLTGAVFEIDPISGAIIRTVMGNIDCPTGLVVDPLSGDLFFSVSCFGAGSDNPSLWRISNPASATPALSVYATLPGTPTSWITIAPNGTIYMAQTIQGPPGAPVLAISGTDKPFPPTMTPVPNLNTIYWIGMGEALPNGAAKSLIVLQDSTIRLADITTDPPTYTDLILNGAGSGTIGPDGCLYVSSVDTVYKLAPTSGGCGFAASNPGPALALSPLAVSPNPAQGAAQTFTASVLNTSAPAGTEVTFEVVGPNAQVRSATTDANGKATMTYHGNLAGTDTISARASVGTVQMTSATATITWGAGSHATSVNLQLSPGTASVAHATSLSATLVDISVTPNVPIAGASIQFTIGAQSCAGVTGASGVATCAIAPVSGGTFTLAAAFAGKPGFLASSVSQQIVVLGATSSVSPAPTAVDFGFQLVGTTSAQRTVVLTNSGTSGFTLSSIALGGANAADFALGAGANACVASGNIAANGGSCTLYLTFSPAATGARSAAVIATDNGSSITVTVPLTGSGTPAPALVSVVSRKTHGTAGVMDFTLSANPLAPSTEPRTGGAGGNHTLVFKFDKPVTGGTAAISEGAATLGAPAFNGNEMTVPLSGVTNAQSVSVAVGNVTSSDGGVGGAGATRLGFLFGDVNQSRQVLVSDVGIVNSSLLQPVSAANFLRDVNVDGRLTVSDVGLTNSVLLTKLPAP